MKFEQHLEPEKFFFTWQLIKYQLVWERRSHLIYLCSMYLLVAILCQDLWDMARKLLGKHEIYSQILLLHCWSWHLHLLKFQNNACISLRGLSSLSTTEKVLILIKLGSSFFAKASCMCKENFTNIHCSRAACEASHLLSWLCLVKVTQILYFLLQVAGVGSRQMLVYMSLTGPHFKKYSRPAVS